MNQSRAQAILLIMGLLSIGICYGLPVNAGATARPEIRAVWVDAFHDGAKTPQQIDQLVQDCLKANLNTLIVQVRRRGDAYYNKSFEPRTEDPKLPAGFDALQYLIERAHANHLEVHAWLNTLVAWNSETPPKDPNHVWNLHGPTAVGAANWISYYRKYNKTTKSWSEQLYPSYFLDPGNPAVIDYTTKVYLNVVKNYEVDGIHLDYSRYDGLEWGYNAVNVERYNNWYGTTGLPLPDDPRWMQWRRDQTANLVRKIYLQAIALKPQIKVSSAVITWGDGPVALGGWEKSMAYTVTGQDWRGWLEEGIIDLAIGMNYFPEWNQTRRPRYDQWIEWEKDHQYGRQTVIGPGAFSQYIEESLAQIRRAQQPSAAGNYAAGVALFAYGWNNLYSNDDYQKNAAGAKQLPRQPHVYRPETNDLLFGLLSSPGSYRDPVACQTIVTEPVFPSPAAIPDMPWKSRPTKGYLMGTISDPTGKKRDRLKITLEAVENGAGVKKLREAYTDGSGWYGFAELPPGNYRIWIDQERFAGEWVALVTIRPGQVGEANFALVAKNSKAGKQAQN